MKLWVVAVGDRMPAWVDEACREYLKRMPRKVELVAIKPAKLKSIKQNLALEAGRILAALPKDCERIALDERGETWTTEALAQRLAKWQEHGENAAFIIGGAGGLAAELKTATTLSLSALTLPHGLARVMLIEQLYRAFSILDNHPYHRA